MVWFTIGTSEFFVCLFCFGFFWDRFWILSQNSLCRPNCPRTYTVHLPLPPKLLGLKVCTSTAQLFLFLVFGFLFCFVLFFLIKMSYRYFPQKRKIMCWGWGLKAVVRYLLGHGFVLLHWRTKRKSNVSHMVRRPFDSLVNQWTYCEFSLLWKCLCRFFFFWWPFSAYSDIEQQQKDIAVLVYLSVLGWHAHFFQIGLTHLCSTYPGSGW